MLSCVGLVGGDQVLGLLHPRLQLGEDVGRYPVLGRMHVGAVLAGNGAVHQVLGPLGVVLELLEVLVGRGILVGIGLDGEVVYLGAGKRIDVRASLEKSLHARSAPGSSSGAAKRKLSPSFTTLFE